MNALERKGKISALGAYTVTVGKEAGDLPGVYHVAALSAGGAEIFCLSSVYQARTALAVEGWPEGVLTPDMVTPAAGKFAASLILAIGEGQPMT